MLRTATLSLILLATIATMLPAGEWLTEAAFRAATAQQSQSRRHSRAWWRRHRAQLRRQRALAAARRRRRWALRRRAVARAQAPARITLAQSLMPVQLSDASPSSLDSIAIIAEQVSASAPVIAVSTPSPAEMRTASSASAPTNAPASSPVTAQSGQTVKAETAATVLVPVASKATSSAATNHMTANLQPANAPAFNAPAQSPPAPATMLAHASQVVAPLVKVATNASALVGRDPHKFSALPAPRNWTGVSSTLGGEYKFSLRATDGRQSGVAVWARMNLSAQPTLERRNSTFAGVAHSSLRRTVIDRMIAEGGWVVNDFEREIAGQKVYVVVAQSESNGLRRSWTYYFVNLDGQLFSLATTAPTEFAGSVASEAEQTLTALAARHASAGAAQN